MNIERQPKLMLDTDGQPMVKIKRFKAVTYEEAQEVQRKVRGSQTVDVKPTKNT